MQTAWEERFKGVVGCVYRVLFDVNDTMQELKEHLYATGKIGPMVYQIWPRAGSAGEAKACALDASTTRLCDMTNAVMNSDLQPIVDRSAVPAAFENIKKCIEEMRAQVESVEQEYDGDCAELKTSMETAVTRLETYLLEEKQGAEHVKRRELEGHRGPGKRALMEMRGLLAAMRC